MWLSVGGLIFAQYSCGGSWVPVVFRVYPLFVFLASILGGLMCGVPVCGPVLGFVFFATILLLLHVCVLLRGVSVPCFCCPLAIAVACLRILPLCLYGSGVFVVFGGCVTTVMFLIVVLRVRIGTHRATIKLALQVSETINRT